MGIEWSRNRSLLSCQPQTRNGDIYCSNNANSRWASIQLEGSISLGEAYFLVISLFLKCLIRNSYVITFQNLYSVQTNQHALHAQLIKTMRDWVLIVVDSR